MPTNLNKKILDFNIWEKCSPCPIVPAVHSFLIESAGADRSIMLVNGTSVIWLYSALENGWNMVPASGLTGTIGMGACGCYSKVGPTITAQAGSGGTTRYSIPLATNVPGGTLKTNLTILTSIGITGYVVSGTSKGTFFTVDGSTTDANATLYCIKADGTYLPLDTSSVVKLYTGRFYVFIPDSSTTGSFRYFDYLTQTWSANLSTTGLPSGWFGGGFMGNNQPGLLLTTITLADTATTTTLKLNLGTANLLVGARIGTDTGSTAGEYKIITANDGTTITVNSAWSGTPALGTVFNVYADDDIIYQVGNYSTVMRSYQPSTDTWSTVSTTASRGDIALNDPCAILTVPKFLAGTSTLDINALQIYSARGDGTTIFDVYNVSTKAWSTLTYGRSWEGFNPNVSWTFDRNKRIYCQISPTLNQPSRFVCLDLNEQALVGVTSLTNLAGTIVRGNRFAMQWYDTGDGAPYKYLYFMPQSSSNLYRMLTYSYT